MDKAGFICCISERQIAKKGMNGLTTLKKFITEKEGEIQESVFKIRALNHVLTTYSFLIGGLLENVKKLPINQKILARITWICLISMFRQKFSVSLFMTKSRTGRIVRELDCNQGFTLGSSVRLTMESFKCIKVLGRGTFGSVHLVYRKDDKKQKRMAMKTIKKEPIEIVYFSRPIARYITFDAKSAFWKVMKIP